MNLLVKGIFDPFNNDDIKYFINILKKNKYNKIYIQSISDNIERANKIINSYIYRFNKLEIYNNQLIDDVIEYNKEIIIDKHLLEKQDKKSMHVICDNLYYFEDIIKTMMDTKRYNHTIQVAILASKFAKKHKLNYKKGYLMGLLHDCSKQAEDNLEIMNKYYKEYVHLDKGIYHQYTGVYYCKKYFNIKDKDILNAILGHTTHTDNSLYGMILYVADKAEITRNYDTTNYINTTMNNLYKGYNLVKYDCDKIYNDRNMVIK